MRRRRGYLLLESVVSLSIIMILMGVSYYLLFFCMNTKTKIEDKIELQQQASEISKYIEEIIGNSKGIISISSKSNEESDKLLETNSIKCKYRNESSSDKSIKDKEISLKEDKSKLFINTLNYLGNSESGGYEIGDYIDKMYAFVYEDGNFVKVRLKLSKNNQIHETEFDVFIRNFNGDCV
ncbi:type II secretion system protein [Clostridium sp. CCUG 7971]|uniref:type II secretion system protein n=1 Tax=Clostridium sp. CCUG 7971 TaxID=2811414 RepID=UPI001ABB486D|nr:type II secretion system protein [Clostridium sp. CCUG 7971]MBO3443761.1 type II secretion system protein [Clostridium sp. CCUG 7971]